MPKQSISLWGRVKAAASAFSNGILFSTTGYGWTGGWDSFFGRLSRAKTEESGTGGARIGRKLTRGRDRNQQGPYVMYTSNRGFSGISAGCFRGMGALSDHPDRSRPLRQLRFSR